jgi:hypothetical protein
MKKYLLLLSLYLAFNSLLAQPTNTNISNGFIFDGEPYLAINPTNNQNIVAAWMGMKFSNGLFRIAIKTRASFDGGTNWSTVNTLPHFGLGYGSADPSMSFDNNGNLYLAYIDYKQSPDSGGIYIARSIDGGLNWDTLGKAFDMYDIALKRPIDRPWLVVDKSLTVNGGTMYITTKPAPWIAPPNRPYYKVSTDSGQTWTSIANLDGTGYLVGSSIKGPMAAPTTTADGKFCAIYPSYVATQNILPCFYLASSSNQGQNFSYNLVYSALPSAQDTNLKNAYTLHAHPSNPNNMLFIGPIPNGVDADIVASNSTDGGLTWNTPVRVNDDALNNGKHQDMVWASYNEQGNIAAVWRDRRNDIANGFWNVGYDFYYALSTDNGQTWLANQIMSSQFISFDSLLAGDGNDFLSAVYSGDTLYTVWGDTRSGSLNIWFAKTIASTNTTVDINILNDSNDMFEVFPNPAKHQLQIKLDQSLISKSIQCYNFQGQKVYHYDISERLNIIDVSQWKPGIYFVKIDTKVQRIVID